MKGSFLVTIGQCELTMGIRALLFTKRVKKFIYRRFLFGYYWKIRSYYWNQDTTIHKKHKRNTK